MSLKFSLNTDRLQLNPIADSDAEFMQSLVNTDGWKKYIGDRNVQNLADAENYIQKMNSKSDCQTWTVKHIENNVSIGIITYIKRDYLDYHDLGFALLPEFQNHGFGFEAANAVLDYFRNKENFSPLYATTIPENDRSIRLLEKLGFRFDKEIEQENEKLRVYVIE